MPVMAARRLEAESTAELVRWTRRYLGLTYSELGSLAGATTRTAQRWGATSDLTVPSGEHRAKLEQLRELKRLLASTFVNDRVALEWLHREVPLLQGRRPIDLIRRGELQQIIEVLAGAHAGAFA
jgi:uncharacterized protein (DUF2384 family)